MSPDVPQAPEPGLPPRARSCVTQNYPSADLRARGLTFGMAPGPKALTLRVLNDLIENGRPNATLVSLVRDQAIERDMDGRFLIPVDKVRRCVSS